MPRRPGARRRATLLALVAALAPLSGCERGGAPAAAPAVDAESAAALALRERALAVAAREFPDLELTTSLDPWVLNSGDAELHLKNLHAKCVAAGGLAVCDGVIRQHLATIVESLAAPAARPAASWDEAATRVRPQLAPGDFLERIELVYEPFAAGLVTAFVIDDERSYRYVTAENLAQWGVDLAAIRAAALANLERATRDIPVQASEGDDRLLAVEVGDGYDATRLLLPGFRRFAGERLGEPYLAAIPNRDVLVLWSKGSSPAFQARVRAQIGSSYRNGAYPLTDRTFEVGADGVRALPN